MTFGSTDIELEDYTVDEHEGEETDQEVQSGKSRSFNRVIKSSPVYYAALIYAWRKNGCLKLFSRAEDMSIIRDEDIFIHVGENSKRIGLALQHGYDIEVLSGLAARKLVEKQPN